MYRTAMEAHYAKAACSQPALTYLSDHARNFYITTQLNHQFKEQFDMSDATAKTELAEEMSRRYSPNPWDAPGPRRPRPQRRTPVAEKEKVEERSEREKLEERSEEARKAKEEQWDLFERQFGYK